MDGFQNIINALMSFDLIALIEIIFMTLVLFILFKFFIRHHYEAFMVALVIAMTVGVFVCAFCFPILTTVYKNAFILALVMAVVVYWQEINRTCHKFSHLGITSVDNESSAEELEQSAQSIIRAVLNLAKKDIGALIVIVKNDIQDDIIESGTALHSLVSSQLLESIFNPKTPLHDGAVIIKGNKVVSAGCFLPLSQDTSIPKDFGTRHRAGIGVTENNDVLAIVVSEETGIISICSNGVIKRYMDSRQLKEAISEIYGLSASNDSDWKKKGEAVGFETAAKKQNLPSRIMHSFGYTVQLFIGSLVSSILFWLVFTIANIAS